MNDAKCSVMIVMAIYANVARKSSPLPQADQVMMINVFVNHFCCKPHLKFNMVNCNTICKVVCLYMYKTQSM